jgi:hypothetical protein
VVPPRSGACLVLRIIPAGSPARPTHHSRACPAPVPCSSRGCPPRLPRVPCTVSARGPHGSRAIVGPARLPRAGNSVSARCVPAQFLRDLPEPVLPSATREKESKSCRTSFGAVVPPTRVDNGRKQANGIQGLHSMLSAKGRWHYMDYENLHAGTPAAGGTARNGA